jgi:uncharacterized protein (TIGR00297 family)
MDPQWLMIAEIALTFVLSWLVYRLHCLSKSGAVASTVVGILLAVFGSFSAFFIMTFFVIMSFFATMRDIDRKVEMGLQEGQFGERGWKNVAAVAFPPVLITIVHYFTGFDQATYVIMFLTSVVVAGSDTIASEMGVKDPKTYLITTFERVPPGTDGGISLFGTLVSTIAALVIAVIGWAIMAQTVHWAVLIPFAFGVFGNLLDSVFGALIERKGLISKYTNNWSTELISALLAGGFWILVHG